MADDLVPPGLTLRAMAKYWDGAFHTGKPLLPACPHADEPFLADLPAMATVADYEKALGIKPGTLQNLGTEPLSSPD